MDKRRARRLAVRMALSAALLSCVYLVATRAVALWYFRHRPLPAGAQQALRWDPENPDIHGTLGRYYEQSPLDGDVQKALLFYEKAVALAPTRARFWTDLGGAYERVGRPRAARRAFERARALFPRSPRINSRLGNFYLRQDRARAALLALRKTLAGDPALRTSAFDLTWRAGLDPDLILHGMLPPDVHIHFQYLHYLVRTGRLDAASAVWQKILGLAPSLEPRLVFSYLDALRRDRRIDSLRSVWREVCRRSPALSPPDREENLVHNGGFESRILNGGLGWRIQPVPGAVVRVDTTMFFGGTRSLRIDFTGEKNLHYRHIRHYVPVEPNRRYRFVAFMKAEKLTTDSGPRFRLQDTYDRRLLEVETEAIRGTASWTRYELDFVTGSKTRLVLIRLVRSPSRKFDNQIAGTAWIDQVSLQAVR